MKKYFKKKVFNRRLLRRKKPSKLSFALGKAKPSAYKRRLFRQMNTMAEVKYFSSSTTAISGITTAGLPLTWLFPAQGLDRDDRVGNKIFVRYMVLKIHIENNNTNTPNCWYRMLVVIPKNVSFGALNLPSTGYGQVDLDKFTVLKDKRIMISQQNVAISATDWQRQHTVKLKIMKTFTFDDASGTTPIEPTPIVFLWGAHSVVPAPRVIDRYFFVSYTDI